jgi:hypothetical protein
MANSCSAVLCLFPHQFLAIQGSFKLREQNKATGSHVCWVGMLSSLWNSVLTKNYCAQLSGQVHCEFVTHRIPTLWLDSVYCTISAVVSRNVGSYSNLVKCTDNTQYLCDKKKTISITDFLCTCSATFWSWQRRGSPQWWLLRNLGHIYRFLYHQIYF